MSRDSSPRRRFPKDLPLEVANRIDELCDRFESGWKSGVRPTIDQFLTETPEAHRAYLFGELVRIDLEYRGRHGETASVDEYLSQYPTFSAVLSSIRDEANYLPTVTVRTQPIRRLGRYEFSFELGEGGYGVVWRAWDSQLRRWVAVKVPKERLDTAEREKMFLKEARAAADLEHPHIVPVLDAGTIDGTAYIVSRLIEGDSLRKWIGQRPRTPAEIALLVARLADAMEYARSKEIVHRDLKPSNVLMDADGSPHITDFGMALRPMEGASIEASGTIAGTPAYMSPEQVLGRPRADHRADVYALGATLYDLLTGKPPFEGTIEALFSQILTDEPPPLRAKRPDVPQDLETVCRKAMAKNRNDRYQTAGELAADLRRVAEGQPIVARRPGLVERAGRWARRNRALAAVLAVLLVAVGASVVMGVAMAARPAAAPENGHRLVQITTKPEGARIVFWKLSDITGEPTPEDESTRFEAPTRSPVTKRPMELPPGEYLVVAALEDGRFHEVYRRVPWPDEKLGLGPVNRYHRKSTDFAGGVELPTITIPEIDVAAGMARIDGIDEFPVSVSTAGEVRRISIPAFDIDPTELIVGQYKKTPTSKVTNDARYMPVADDHALCMPFDDCVRIAEERGKRLPTASEHECAATTQGRRRFPWGPRALDDDQRVAAAVIGPVGAFVLDRLETEPRVYGLCSNAAEWTMTYASPDNPKGRSRDPVDDHSPLERIVKGTVPGLTPADDAKPPSDPRQSTYVSRYEMNAGLGMRCVRSARPRWTAVDFRANSD